MLHISPLAWAQMALEKPELVAQYMAAQGKPVPQGGGLNIQTASFGGGGGQDVMPSAPASQAAAAPAPQLSPMPAPTTIASIPPPVPLQQGPAPAAAASGPGAPPAPAPTAAPVANPMDAFAQAMVGLQPPTDGGTASPRMGMAPAPFIQGATPPQTATILDELIKRAMMQGAPALNLGR